MTAPVTAGSVTSIWGGDRRGAPVHVSQVRRIFEYFDNAASSRSALPSLLCTAPSASGRANATDEIVTWAYAAETRHSDPPVGSDDLRGIGGDG